MTNYLVISSFFFIFLSLSSGLTINTYEIRDLESNNTNYFQNEAALWNVTNLVGSDRTSQCSGIWLMGGYQITTTGAIFSRTYTSLPAHNMIYFSIYVWYIDMNEQADLFQIYFDNQYVQDINSNRYSSFGGLDYCGGSTWDYARSRVEGSVAHNTSTLTFKILSKFNSASNSFSLGFRDLDLLFSIRSSPITSACLLQSSTYNSDVSCVCPQGQYDRSGSAGCTTCSSSCKTCMGSSASDCTACPFGSSFDGNSCFQCYSTCSQCNGTLETDCIRCRAGSFLYWNGTCQTSCPVPLAANQTQGEFQSCHLPCELSSDFYYENSTCHSTCPSSFTQIIQGDLKLCNFRCSGSSSEYLYSNGSCLSSCPTSFNTKIQGVERYCDFKCSGSSEYLYSNGSCGSSCPTPFNNMTQGVEKHCIFPCSSTDYFYENGSCSPTCNSPYKATTIGSVKYCNKPCTNGKFYNKAGKSCVSICPSLIQELDGVKYCKNVVESTTSSSLGNTLESILTGSSMIGGILRPNNLNSAFLVGLAKLLKYVHYLDVDIPQDIRDSMSLNHTGGFCITQMFSYNMPENLKEQFSKSHNLPFYIEQSGVHSSFLVNHWQTMSTYVFLCLITILSGLVEKLVLKTKWERLAMVMTRIRVILKWNFVLFIFFNTYDDITFFAILELKTLHFDSFLSVFSFILCLGIVLLAIFLLYRGLIICRGSILQESHTNEAQIQFYKKWEDYQVLYAGLKNDSWMTQYYLLIYILRIVICYILAGALYDHPIIQTVQFLLLSLLLTSLLIRYKPIRDPFAYLVNLTYEVLILIVNICLVILAISSSLGKLEKNLQYGLSRTILVCNSLVNIFSNLFSWGYIITGIIIAYKTSKKYQSSGKTVWLSVPVSPYSNPGMDYSDLTYWENGQPPAVKGIVYPKRVRIIPKKRVVPLSLSVSEKNGFPPPESDFEDLVNQISPKQSDVQEGQNESSLFGNLRLSTNRQMSNRKESLIYRNNGFRKSSVISPSNQETTTIIINSIDDFESSLNRLSIKYEGPTERNIRRRVIRRHRNSFLSPTSS